MPREQTSPVVRLERLKSVRAKLPRFKRDETLNARPMAELIGVGWPVLKGWCDDVPELEASGAVVRGGNGIEYRFKPRATIDCLIRHFDSVAKIKAAKGRRVRQIVSGGALDDVPEDMTLDDIAKMMRISAQLREEGERAGRLVDAGIVSGAVTAMVTKMQQAGLQAAREQDPTGQFPPEIASKFEDAINSVIIRMQQAGQDCLKALRGGTA